MATAGIGNTYAKANLDQDLGSGSPATWYPALLTTMPTDGDASSLAECSYTGYSRPTVTNNNTNFPAASIVSHIAQKAVQTSIAFPTVTSGGPVTVVGIALYDDPTSAVSTHLGRTAVFGTIAAPVTYTLNNGSSLSIASGNAVFQET